MLTAKRSERPLINQINIACLANRYEIPFLELFERFAQLKIQPQEIDGGLYIDGNQLRYLDHHHASLQGTAEAFLYRCNETGDLWLVDTPLHMSGDQGNSSDGRMTAPTRFEFIACGLNEHILGLAHSLMLSLTDAMNGI